MWGFMLYNMQYNYNYSAKANLYCNVMQYALINAFYIAPSASGNLNSP